MKSIRSEVAELMLTVGPAVGRLCEASLEKLETASGLRHRILHGLASSPRSTAMLAASVGVSSPTASASVDLLVAQGCVERQPRLGDRRVTELHITSGGRRRLRAMDRAMRAEFERLLADIDEAALRALATGLRALGAALALQREHDHRGVTRVVKVPPPKVRRKRSPSGTGDKEMPK